MACKVDKLEGSWSHLLSNLYVKHVINDKKRAMMWAHRVRAGDDKPVKHENGMTSLKWLLYDSYTMEMRRLFDAAFAMDPFRVLPNAETIMEMTNVFLKKPSSSCTVRAVDLMASLAIHVEWFIANRTVKLPDPGCEANADTHTDLLAWQLKCRFKKAARFLRSPRQGTVQSMDSLLRQKFPAQAIAE